MPKCKTCEGSFGFFELKDGVCKACVNKKLPPCSVCGKNFDASELTDGYCKSCHVKEKHRHKLRKEARQLQIQEAGQIEQLQSQITEERTLKVSKRQAVWSSYNTLLSEHINTTIGMNIKPAGHPKPVILISVTEDFFTVGDVDSGVYLHMPYQRIVLIEEVEEGKEMKLFLAKAFSPKIMVHIDYPVVYKGFIGFGMDI